MNLFSSLVFKVLNYIHNTRIHLSFIKSKKYVSSWGVKTYGQPEIICYDSVSRLSVGNYTSIASTVSILLGSNHKGGLITTFPRSLINKNISQKETNERGDVTIGNDVWIGYGVTIVGPVVIGDGAIIGAEALVVDDVAPYAVVGGVPARVIKYRFTQEEINILQKTEWWNLKEDTVKEKETMLYSSNVQAFVDSF